MFLPPITDAKAIQGPCFPDKIMRVELHEDNIATAFITIVSPHFEVLAFSKNWRTARDNSCTIPIMYITRGIKFPLMPSNMGGVILNKLLLPKI